MKTLAALVVLLCVLFAGVSAHAHSSSISKRSLKCAACGYFVNEITERTAGLIDPVEIHVAVFGMCSSITDDKFQAKCTRFLSRHGEKIVDTLIKGESLDGFCKCQAKMPVEVSTKYCAICQFLVTELENAARNNEPALIKVLERACNVLPNSYRTTCEGIIETFGPMIIEKFLNLATPEKVCAKLHLCPAAKKSAPETPAVPEAPVVPVEDGLQCEFCKFVIGYVQEHLADPTNQEAVERVLQNICKVIPKQMEDQCEMIIKTYYPVLIEYITQNLPPEVVCQKIKLCAGAKLIDVVPVTTESDLGCTVCQFLMRYLQAFITGDETAEELEKLLRKGCSHLPDPFVKQCNSLMDVFGPQLVQWIIQNGAKHLEEFCTSAGICPKSTIPAAESELGCTVCKYITAYLQHIINGDETAEEIDRILRKGCSILPNAFVKQCNSLVDVFGPQLIQWIIEKGVKELEEFCTSTGICPKSTIPEMPVFDPAAESELGCTVCKYITAYLQHIINGDETAEEIDRILRKGCSVLPNAFVKQCNSLVDVFGPQLIQWIIEKGVKELEEFCTSTGICPKTQIMPESNLKCAVCEYIVAFLQDRLKDDVTQQRIEQLLEEVCHHFPTSIQSQCTAVVSIYTPVIIDWFINKYPADKLCAQLKLCTASEFQMVAKPGQYCAICQFVMQYVVDYIAKDSTEEKIIAAVEKVCNVFPKSLAPTCKAFVETYGPQLIELLLKKETPEVICHQIRACVSAVEKEPEQASFLCAACEFAMVELEQFLSQNRTQQEIADFLKRVCDLIPENVRGMCHVLVDLELPNILEWIKSIPPNQICTAIGACKRQTRVSPIQFIAMNQVRA